MGRIRSIKPEVLLHESLFDLEAETGLPVRLAFIGLWTQSDKAGRFQWRPRALKTQIMPYDDVDFSRVLDALTTRGFVCKYACGGDEYGFVPSWNKHQFINNREKESSLPDPFASDCEIVTSARVDDASTTRERNYQEEGEGKGKGKEGKGKGKCGEVGEQPTPPDDSPVVLLFPVVGGTSKQWPLTQAKIDEYRDSFPGVDVVAACRHARQWCIDNVRNRKTADGMGRFLTAWLSKEQNSARTAQPKNDVRGNLALRDELLAAARANPQEAPSGDPT